MSSGSISSVTKHQPPPTTSPTTDHIPPTETDTYTQPTSRFAFLSRFGEKFTSREGWFGDYDYRWMCMPTLPISSKGDTSVRRLPPFYGLDDDIPLFLALSCGLQHALAMLAGLITPPIIFASSLNLSSEMTAYMISASLIGCGE
jgi:hypothetical protein